MANKYNYNQQMNIKYDHLELMVYQGIVAENKESGLTRPSRKLTAVLPG